MSVKNEKYVCKLSPELQERARVELNEDPARRAADIEALRQWLAKQPHIHGRTDDEFLLRFLRNCKFSIERAKEKMDNFYTLKGAIPEWFANRDLDNPVLMGMIKAGIFVPLGYDENGRRIIIARVADLDPSKFKLDDMMKANCLLSDYLMLDEQTVICGSVIISDMHHFSGAHAAMFTPSVAKKMMMAWQDCMPVRTKGLHYLNPPAIFEAVFSIIKIFMKKKMLDRVNMHGSKLESLHASISPKYLPKEYGGTAGCLQDYLDKTIKDLMELKDYLKLEETFKADESKRLGKSKAYEDLFCVDGTFRKLEID